MKFGVREICDVVFKAKSDVTIGNSHFKKGQPVLYIDSAKTSTVEGAATTVYATGGRGNTRLIAWEGEKTLTFTVEDALLSPIGFSILSGAGLLQGIYGPESTRQIHVHKTSTAQCSSDEIDLTDALGVDEKICPDAPIFVMRMEDGDLTGDTIDKLGVDEAGKKLIGTDLTPGSVFVDYYVIKSSATVDELQIDAENFAGYYYVEASTLFRRQSDGVDMPAELTFPNVKIQSNFTFSMASSGDPSTFTFTMDAFPGYTYFDPTRKVLCAMQIVTDTESTVTSAFDTVFPHDEEEQIEESEDDSVNSLSLMDMDEAPLGEIKVSQMIGPDVQIKKDGSVVGTIKYISNFEAFSSNSEEKKGNFFPIKFNDSYKDKYIIVKKKDGNVKAVKDREWILRVDKDKVFDFYASELPSTIGPNAKHLVSLNFKNAILEGEG